MFSLVRRELCGRYKGSVLGFFWTFISPLLQLGVYTLVFSVIMREGIEQYYLFLFVALVPWLFFSASFMWDGEPVTADELLRRMRRYRGVFRASKGGITLSGGEVLMQPAFAARLLAGAKKMGIHTCIDTSGYLGANCTDEMLDDIDLVLLDVKSGDEQTYKRVTGRSLAPTIAFGDRLATRGIETWVRFVLVPGLTDDPANVENVARIVERWRPVVSRDFLGKPFYLEDRACHSSKKSWEKRRRPPCFRRESDKIIQGNETIR